MSNLVIALLVLFWILGYIQIPGLVIPNPTIFIINGYAVSLVDILIFGLIIWALEILPKGLREVAFVLLILWVLSTLGIVAIAHLGSMIILALLFVLLFSKTSK